MHQEASRKQQAASMESLAAKLQARIMHWGWPSAGAIRTGAMPDAVPNCIPR